MQIRRKAFAVATVIPQTSKTTLSGVRLRISVRIDILGIWISLFFVFFFVCVFFVGVYQGGMEGERRGMEE